MNQPELQDTADLAATPASQRQWRPAMAFITTAVVTAVSFPVHLFLAFMFSIASSRYDTSGQGGPFKNCDSAAECSDPNYLWILGTAGLMVLLWLVAAQVGQLAWGRQPRLSRVLSLGAFSAALTVAGWAIVYYLMTHATHAIF